MLLTIFHGFSMGVANSVPGVSGGTIAFILGFYDNFINSLHNIVSKDKKIRNEAIFYLIKLGIGIVIGLLLCILLLTKLFETHVYSLCSAFIGLTVAAIPFVIIQEKETLKGRYYNIVWAILGLALVVGLSLLRELGLSVGTVNFVTGLSALQYIYVFIAGAFAISAMVLPGISGSTILLIFGVYMPVLEAVKEILHFNWTFKLIAGVFCFGMGIIVGIVASIKGIKVALEKARQQTVWFILGMMVGSVYAIMMGPTTLDVPKEAMGLNIGADNGLRIIALLVGAVILVGLELFKKFTENKNGSVKAQ